MDTFFQRLFCFFPHGLLFLPHPFSTYPFQRFFTVFQRFFIFESMCFFQRILCFFQSFFVTDQNEFLMVHPDIFHMLSVICTIKILTVALMAWVMGSPMWKIQCVGKILDLQGWATQSICSALGGEAALTCPA